MFRLALDEDTYLEKVELRHADAFLRTTEPIREDIGRYFAVRQTAEEWRQWIGEYRDLDAQDAGLACGIWRKGELVGMICILEISRHYLSCSLACWMAPGARGGGLAARATQALTTYAFEALALERVVIRVAIENFASQRVPERLGFRFEGVARSAEVIGDRFLDVAIYAMLAPEWPDACVRAERTNAARLVRPEDEAWIAALPCLVTADVPTVETLVVTERGALGYAADGTVTRLALAPHAKAARTLFDRAEGELRRRGVPLLRTRSDDPRALMSLGFFPLGDGGFGKWVGDLGLSEFSQNSNDHRSEAHAPP